MISDERLRELANSTHPCGPVYSPASAAEDTISIASELLGRRREQDGETLEAELCLALRDWIRREAPRLRDGKADIAEIKIRISQPQSEDDGTLYLDYEVDETSNVGRSGAAVTGVPFEPEH